MIHLELTEEEAGVVVRELRARLHSYFQRLDKNLTPGVRKETERRLSIVRGLVDDLKVALEE